MGLYKYIRETWKKPKTSMPDLWQKRLIKWRKDPVIIRIKRPTRLDRARSLGYKAKQGFVLVRQRVSRGSHRRPNITKGRRPKHSRQKMILNMSYQTIAEQRANKKYKNCEILNSYWVAQDAQYKWYEIILVDPMHPQILADKRLNWMFTKRGRVFRGLTSSARRSRGLHKKGKGSEHTRPSKNADLRRRGKK